jgi:hypothetical protein
MSTSIPPEIIKVQTSWGEVELLRIFGLGISWEERQRVKEELVGDRLAIEIFPRRENFSPAKEACLWVLPDDFDLPFGLHKMTQNQWPTSPAT